MWLSGPPTPQHTVSHHCTRPPSWGTRANLGGTTNFRAKINGKLRRIILLRIDLITFRFAYVRNRNLTCSWSLDCRTPRDSYLWIWIYKVSLKSKKMGDVLNILSLQISKLWKSNILKQIGKGRCGGVGDNNMKTDFVVGQKQLALTRALNKHGKTAWWNLDKIFEIFYHFGWSWNIGKYLWIFYSFGIFSIFWMIMNESWNPSTSWKFSFENLWDLVQFWYILGNQFLNLWDLQ